MLIKENFTYSFDSSSFRHVLFYSKSAEGKLPVVLVLPTWMGLNRFAFEKAEEMAQLGYLAVAYDHYGEGKAIQDPEEAKKQMLPLLEDRNQIRLRIKKTIQEVGNHPKADKSKIAAIGYCFGGSSVLELAKSGFSIRGVVSIHGVLGNPHHIHMKPVPTADHIPASILVLQGFRDKLSSEQDLLNFQKSMDARNADWQMFFYGGAMHGFTNPEANLPEQSLQYDEKTALRAFHATKQFLREIFEG